MSVEAPASVEPTLEEATPEPPEAEHEDEDAPAYDVLDYPDPITHGMGIQVVLRDLDAEAGSTYRRTWEAWQDAIEDPEDEPLVVIEDAHLRFDWFDENYPGHIVLRSKGWKAGPSPDNRYYEYSLQFMRYDPETGDLEPEARAPISWQVWIQPQDTELVYKSGDSLEAPYGEGTRLRCQTTYANPSEALNRTAITLSAALEALGKPRPEWDTLNRESFRVWKGEVHHRFSKELMSVVAEKLREARTLLEHGGQKSVEGQGEYQSGRHVEELVRSNMWDRLGFAGVADNDGYELGLKVYRYGSQPADERLRHPKLEAYLASTNREAKLPHAEEWVAFRATLRQITNTFAIRSGVALADLRQDDYYDGHRREMIDTLVPKGWRRAMREANEERERKILKTTYESLSMAKWDILWCVATFDGITYEQLEEVTGLAYNTVREYVADLEEKDILRRTTYPRLIVYHNEELRLNALEALQEVHPDEGVPEIKERGQERRERRENRQENEEDASAEDGSESDSATETASDEADESEAWHLFREVLLNGDQLGRALSQGYIEPDHVKIRTDPYPELFQGID